MRPSGASNKFWRRWTINTIHIGDAQTVLQTLPVSSVHCVVTSPSYWGLRDYGHPDQIGREQTPELYTQRLADVFDEVARVLRPDGTLWLNIGDSYANDGKWGGRTSGKHVKYLHDDDAGVGRQERHTGLPPKSLVGIPWRLAFALQERGWILRSEIVWHKPNPMPEAVKDRPTRSHEKVFLFARQQRYFYDADAIVEPSGGWNGSALDGPRDIAIHPSVGRKPRPSENGRPQKARAVELFEQHGFTDAHADAVRTVGMSDAGKGRNIQSGSGCNNVEVQRLADEVKAAMPGYFRELLFDGDTRNARDMWSIAVGGSGVKDHFAVMPVALADRCIRAGCPEGGVVLDPFFGAGTTGLAAQRLDRRCIGIELNPDYAELARSRLCGDAPLFANWQTIELLEANDESL